MPGPEKLRRAAYHFYQLLWTGLDWVYPPICGGCNKPGERWCSDCQSSTEKIPDTICSKCGQIIHKSGICPSCRVFSPCFSSLRSWAVFSGPLRNALHRLKYQGDIALGEIFARPLIEMVKALQWKVDAVVPVPIGIARKAERGYNQAAIIGFPLALGCGFDYHSKWLTKVRETRSQVGLTLAERHENVREAFMAQARSISGLSVLVVDDVTTSGATMQACASALKKAGVKEVYGITLARSVHSEYLQMKNPFV